MKDGGEKEVSELTVALDGSQKTPSSLGRDLESFLFSQGLRIRELGMW